MSRSDRLALYALLALSAVAHTAAANDFRPAGPVTLTADRGEWTQGGQMRYEGNVALTSDTLTIKGQTMDITQLANGQFTANIRGRVGKGDDQGDDKGDLAQLDHAAQPGSTGATAQSVRAQAQQIQYDSRTGVIELITRAHLTRGSDEVSGNAISYVIAERRVRASGGGDSGQVRIVLQPPPSTQPAPPADAQGAP